MTYYERSRDFSCSVKNEDEYNNLTDLQDHMLATIYNFKLYISVIIKTLKRD